MKCSRPFVRGMAEFGCGQCMPCRLNRRRLMTGRLMLEARKHEHSCFVTLTYDKEHYPADGNLSVRELQLYLKRLRKLCAVPIRFYGVGEYGERRGRAHYHLAVYGVSDGALCAKAWGQGNVYVGTLTSDSASYIVSYLCKRMTRKEDKRLDGRTPEFARMSLRPGIGATAVVDFARVITESIDVMTGEYYAMPEGDVTSVFRYNGKSFPLGRYLRRKLRAAIGMSEAEPVICGELRSYRRYVDLSSSGKSGWRVREEEREQAALRAAKRLEISNSKRGVLYETS